MTKNARFAVINKDIKLVKKHVTSSSYKVVTLHLQNLLKVLAYKILPLQTL